MDEKGYVKGKHTLNKDFIMYFFKEQNFKVSQSGFQILQKLDLCLMSMRFIITLQIMFHIRVLFFDILIRSTCLLFFPSSTFNHKFFSMHIFPIFIPFSAHTHSSERISTTFRSHVARYSNNLVVRIICELSSKEFYLYKLLFFLLFYFLTRSLKK